MNKDYNRAQGVVGGVPVAETFTRQIFFPLTQDVIEMIEETGTQHLYSSSSGIGFDPEQYLGMLQDLDAEIFFMLYVKHKAQKDVAKLLGTSQPTVSYRYRRVLDKMSYLMLLASAQLKEMVATIPGLNDKEKAVLCELFRKANQERVGEEFGVRQSTVKWIFTKAKRYIAEREVREPDVWYRQYALFLLLERNLRKRIFC